MKEEIYFPKEIKSEVIRYNIEDVEDIYSIPKRLSPQR